MPVRRIAVINEKGGSGKTTTAVNLSGRSGEMSQYATLTSQKAYSIVKCLQRNACFFDNRRYCWQNGG